MLARLTSGIGSRWKQTAADKMVLRSCWKSRHKSSRRTVNPGLAALVCFCATQFVCAAGQVDEAKKYVIQKDAEFDVTYNGTVTHDNQTIYAFNHTISRNKVSAGLRGGGPRVAPRGVTVSPRLTDGGGARDRGRAAAEPGESHSVCGAAEAGCHVLPGPSQPPRTVSLASLSTSHPHTDPDLSSTPPG